MVFYFVSLPPSSPPDSKEAAKAAKSDDLILPSGFDGTIPEEGCLLYMGRDKFENEELIKFAWPEDVWFHVDKESSAHVYIRLARGAHKSGDPEWYKRIHPKVIEDCCQLVKANSIKGNKLNNISVVFTPASNLKKTGSMEIGQVGFHNPNMVFKAKVESRKNEIVNRLEKTKRWVEADLQAELIARQKEDKAEAAALASIEKAQREEQEAKWKEEKDARDYGKLFDATKMTTAGELEVDSDGEVDFM